MFISYVGAAKRGPEEVMREIVNLNRGSVLFKGIITGKDSFASNDALE